MRKAHCRQALTVVCVAFSIACNDPARPGSKRGKPIDTSLLCACNPAHITKDDWRIELKNGPLPDTEPQDTTVAAILAWPEGPEPGPRTPRFGRELTLYRIHRAYMQTAFFRKSDCDLHIELSQQPGKGAPRMIVETPGRPEYCESRSKVFSELQKEGIALTELNNELATPILVEVVGVAFRDQSHPVWFARGSAKVATLWELHPAIVTIAQNK